MGDWFNGPGEGWQPAMLGPEERELRALGEAVREPLPEVKFSPPAERINPTNRELNFIVPLVGSLLRMVPTPMPSRTVGPPWVRVKTAVKVSSFSV